MAGIRQENGGISWYNVLVQVVLVQFDVPPRGAHVRDAGRRELRRVLLLPGRRAVPAHKRPHRAAAPGGGALPGGRGR